MAGSATAVLPAQTNLFWNPTGPAATWTSSNWSASGSAPFSTAWSPGAIAHFTAASKVTFASTAIGDVIIDPGVAVTVTAGGTVSTGGAVRTIEVGAGGSLVWTNQAVSNHSATGFIKTGMGTWSIGAQPNAYSGGFTLAEGTVVVTGGRSLGTGEVTLAGGTLRSSGGITFAASDLVLGGNVTLAGTGNDFWSMPTTVLAGRQVITNATTGTATRTLAGAITGAGTLVFAGSGGKGGIVLSGASAYSGGTVVEGGLVRALSATSLGSGAAEITGGRLELGEGATFANRFTVGTEGRLFGNSGASMTGLIEGDGELAGSLRLASGALLSPGNGVGTMSLTGELVLEAGSTLVFDLGSTAADFLSIRSGGSLTSNGASVRLVFGDGLGPAGSDPFWNSAQSWTLAAGHPSKAIGGAWVIDNSAWASQGGFQTWYSGDALMLGWQPAVPEPGAYASVAFAAVTAVLIHRLRSRDSDSACRRFVPKRLLRSIRGFACHCEHRGSPRPRASQV